MERSVSGHSHDTNNTSDDDDRRPRFTDTNNGPAPTASLRERAASQPPRSSSDSGAFVSSPPTQHFLPSSLQQGGPWSSSSPNNSRMLSPNRGQPVPMPIRSSSFSNPFSSTMRDRTVFPSTFEDDESEALSDTYDENFLPPSLGSRGRSYGQDISRSRSQSLATPGRPGPVGSPYTGSSAMQSWNESYLSHTNPLSIPSSSSGGGGGGSGGSGQRYGDIKPPSTSRYGSLGTMGRSPTNIHSSSPSSGSFVGNGYRTQQHQQQHQQPDISNMSPFVRDVGQILLDDGSAFRELWAGMHPPKDENGGGGSGTTSRRHSVSVVQPRRGNVVGFNAPGADADELLLLPHQSTRGLGYAGASGGVGGGGGAAGVGGRGRGSGLLLSDDDLASDLGLLNINPNEPPPLPSSSSSGGGGGGGAPSQPSSLPIYAPLSRSPPSRDLMTNYQSINLGVPGGSGSGGGAGAGVGGGGATGYSRQIGTPSDEGYSAGGNSPPRGGAGVGMGLYEEHLQSQYRREQQQHQQQQQEATARFVPGQGIQYVHSQQYQQQAQQQQHGQQQQGSYQQQHQPSYQQHQQQLQPHQHQQHQHQQHQQHQHQQHQQQQYHHQQGSGGGGGLASPSSPSQYVRARAPSYSSTGSGGGGGGSGFSTGSGGGAGGMGGGQGGMGGQGGVGLQSPVSPTSAGGGGRVMNPQQGPYYPQVQQRRLSDAHQHPHPHHPHGHGHQPPTPSSATSSHHPPNPLTDLGRGLPLSAVPPSWPLFICEFKAGRTDLFYLTDLLLAAEIGVGDLVIVEADRGKDLGKVVNDCISVGEVERFQREVGERWGGGGGGGGGQGYQGGGGGQGMGGEPQTPTSPGGGQGGGGQGQGGGGKKEINPKMIYRKAGQQDLQLLATKTEDEVKALQLCQSKVRAKKLPMEVVDAEYQWDRRKLTFYFIAEKRIDFRELVRELFRLYKTRIWMASLQGGGGFEQ
ncbi:hypothetical protein GALMADRAFT_215647 [Galerina marginata CBS 339.88]|uniref:PSP1 C-terminal domain-containing protein n=1 Tax=Galerina marginata (strain CBS 339.88) TaxID=685588 RepID=A0A067SPT2_GALM3|nr:hypothetical protein GALMADRAFT_215647 [Galerina marginata CBS 339.88]